MPLPVNHGTNYGYHAGTKPGLGNAPSYMSSGTPWATGTFLGQAVYWVKIVFPKVTKSFTVINKDPQQLHPSGTYLDLIWNI